MAQVYTYPTVIAAEYGRQGTYYVPRNRSKFTSPELRNRLRFQFEEPEVGVGPRQRLRSVPYVTTVGIRSAF